MQHRKNSGFPGFNKISVRHFTKMRQPSVAPHDIQGILRLSASQMGSVVIAPNCLNESLTRASQE